MNTSGMLRGYLSKLMDREDYFYHVVDCIELQLKEWGKDPILLFNWDKHTELVCATFIIDSCLYHFSIKQETSGKLQEKNPYAIDRYIWEALVKQGFTLQESNYIQIAFQ